MCVYHGTSALGHKLFSWSTFSCIQILLKTMGSFRFSFFQSGIVLVWIFKYCNFLFFSSIKYLTWTRKVRVPICADILKFLRSVVVVIVAAHTV